MSVCSFGTTWSAPFVEGEDISRNDMESRTTNGGLKEVKSSIVDHCHQDILLV